MPRPDPLLRRGSLTLDMTVLVDRAPELAALHRRLTAAGWVLATRTARCPVYRDLSVAIRLRWVRRTPGGPTLRRVEAWRVPLAALVCGAADA